MQKNKMWLKLSLTLNDHKWRIDVEQLHVEHLFLTSTLNLQQAGARKCCMMFACADVDSPDNVFLLCNVR